MYSVLVVDDEKIGRTGISFLLKRLSYDFQIAEAQNGRVALEYIRNHHVDFLLTDIKMPFMDGLELIKEIKKLKLNIKTIILSGYSDFDYAKKAMKMGVSEYILKPIDPQEFELSMQTIINEYEDEKKQKKQMKNSEFLMQEHILTSLLNGNTISQLERKLDGISLQSFLKPYKRILLLEFNNNFFAEHFDIGEQLEKIIPIEYDYLNLNLQQSVLFFTNDDEERLKIIAKQIIQNIVVVYNRRCYIAISKTIDDISAIQIIQDELDDLLDKKYLHPDQQLYLANETSGLSVDTSNIEELITKMDEDIKIKDMEALNKEFIQLQKMYINNDTLSIYYLKFLMSPLIKMVHDILSKSNEYNVDIRLACFYQSNNVVEMMDIFNEFIHELEKVNKSQEIFVHKEIEAVKKYIYTYYNQDISVDRLADYVCLAPSYLSHIFKKETGENLSKFIKRVRMEKARDMLENSYEKIVTISMAVGYQNVSYFCQSFREYFGISPQKFRSQGE